MCLVMLQVNCCVFINFCLNVHQKESVRPFVICVTRDHCQCQKDLFGKPCAQTTTVQKIEYKNNNSYVFLFIVFKQHWLTKRHFCMLFCLCFWFALLPPCCQEFIRSSKSCPCISMHKLPVEFWIYVHSFHLVHDQWSKHMQARKRSFCLGCCVALLLNDVASRCCHMWLGRLDGVMPPW